MTAALDLVGVGDARPTSTAAPTTAVTACATDIVKLGQQPFDSTKDKDGEQSSGQEKRPDCTMADGKKPAPQKHLSLDAFLGRLGSWHMPIFVFGFLRGLPATMSMMYIVFSAPVHQRFWCADSGWANSTFSGGGGSRHDIDPTRDICDGSCRTFEFDRETYGYTIMEQYELVCQRSWLASAAQSLYLTGLMIGGVLNAHISDWWGRRVVIGISLVWTLVAATATTWAPSIEFFVVGRLLTACGVSGFAEAAFTLVVETVSPKARYMPTLTVGTGWSTGLLLLPLAAWLLKDWAVLQLFVAATVVPLIGIWFILPESPRWQLSMGRFDAAEQNLEKLVRRHPHLDKRDVQQLVDERRRATANGADLTGKRPTVATAFNRAYRRSTIVFSFCMAVSSMVWYYLTVSSTTVVLGNPFLGFALAALSEYPAKLFISALIKWMPRKRTLFTSFICSSLTLVVVIFMPKEWAWARLGLVIIGKVSTSVNTSVLRVAMSEAYPTVVRSMAVSFAATIGRFGTTIAPFFEELERVSTWEFLPSAVVAVLCLMASLCTQLLDETFEQPLPDSVRNSKCYNEAAVNGRSTAKTLETGA